MGLVPCQPDLFVIPSGDCFSVEFIRDFFSSPSPTQARGGGRLQRQLAPAAIGRFQSYSSGPCDHKNPSLFRCNNLDFLVSAFPTVVFFDNAEALPTRGDNDGEESLWRLAAWHDSSAKPMAIPFSGSGDNGHNSSTPLIEIVTEPSYLSET
ncbi:hypothetical protein MRB53_005455 [Persea americana]|uniref:Uncharacterized protein n=1 Tax=Persea americana TaxID=3435 RepID=A0ACC2MD31_PERAE|nr:hypothetical protein MRB53_005455 [Persea americana]